MKYIEEFRNGQLAQHFSKLIAREVNPQHHYRLMEFCGGHTHAIHRYGIPSLLPKNINLIHGPGCPVCVLPIARLDQAIQLAKYPHVILCSYGDMLRVPGTHQMSLIKTKAEGADIRMVYSVDDALSIAKANPDKKIVFFAIGFETTTPPTAVALIKAKRDSLHNFFAFCNHVLTPPALAAILQLEKNRHSTSALLDGFIGPAHVSIVIGSNAYKAVSDQYHKPIVISGFEPLDLLHSIYLLIRQINQKRTEIENQYTRAVNPEGNVKSQKLMAEVFKLRPTFEWRGLGFIPNSALQIKPIYAEFDAEKQFSLTSTKTEEVPGCECGSILQGLKKPNECKLFGAVCTPENPVGACMVSSEGACAAYYAYGRLEND